MWLRQSIYVQGTVSILPSRRRCSGAILRGRHAREGLRSQGRLRSQNDMQQRPLASQAGKTLHERFASGALAEEQWGDRVAKAGVRLRFSPPPHDSATSFADAYRSCRWAKGKPSTQTHPRRRLWL